ncbi:hypothetical protein [Epilithonimonas vandammei]|uniref:hypothetical protein n=1 Tax=Epilithonimonas vandammei TaxID=2487072 RepID=UPI00269AA4B5
MKNNTNTTESIETDITNTFGMLYYPKSALVFYETDDYNPDGYVEHFDIDGNGHPVNAHPLMFYVNLQIFQVKIFNLF